MISKTVHCPYCNAVVSLSAEEGTRPRIDCPRCGDSFPNISEERRQFGEGRSSYGHDALTSLPSPQPSRPSNAAVARIVLLAMLFMAVVGLVFAVYTVNYRRANDRRAKEPAPPVPNSPVELVAPINLTGLSYLPSDICFAAGFHAAEFRAHPDGRQLLEKLHSQDVPTGLRQIERWTGLKQENIDHLVIGIRPDDMWQGFTLVIRTRRPYSQAAVAAAQGGAKPASYKNTPVFRLQQRTPKRMLWCADDRTIVIQVHLVSVQLEDLDQIELKPPVGVSRLPAQLREVVEIRFRQDTVLWSAGDVSRVKGLQQLLLFAPKIPPKLKLALSKIDLFSASVSLHTGIMIDSSLHGKDEDAARWLHEFFQHAGSETAPVKVVGPLSEDRPKMKGDQRWVLLQWTLDLQVALEAIEDPAKLLPQ